MLLSLLVKFWLCSVMAVDSWPCSYEEVVFSIRSHHLDTPTGLLLTFSHQPHILQHPCGNQFSIGIPPALYLGERVFLSQDMFESSLLPLTIPRRLTSTPAVVNAANFVKAHRIVLVVNGNVFIYFYRDWNVWLQSKGITSSVTQLATYNCCFVQHDPSCDKINFLVLAYDTGNLASESEIFYSENGGYEFVPLKSRPLRDGILLGVYVFASSADIGMLLKNTNRSSTAYFTYGDVESMKNLTGRPFNIDFWKDNDVESVLSPSMRGFIIIWTNKTLISSPNDGLTTDIVTVLPTVSYPNKTLPEDICFAAATSHEIAALTKSQLFYGNLDMVFSQMVLLGEKNITSPHDPCEAMLFDNTGSLSIISLLPSNVSEYYNFHKCIINIQARLMSLQPPLQPCPMETLTGDFHNRMYYIDTKQLLHFNATFVPKRGTGAYPVVTLSNPHVLAFEAHIVEDGYTFTGNTKYSLQIKLQEQQLESLIKKKQATLFKKLTTVTVDIYNKGIFCIDLYPLTALIAVECPPKKEIKIVKSTTACSKGLFKPRLLQNFVYSVDKELYDPLFLGRKKLEQEDLNVTYDYYSWGCPLLLYYNKPWLPEFELWDDGEFMEYVYADFVLYEIHGMHNYDYLLTEVEANCLSEAQNWTKQLKNHTAEPQNAWSRYNYVSCKEPRGKKSLPSPNSKYQVLNRGERNRILFPQYNGFYVFHVTVVDSLYSYCNLTKTFSVYVYGALPKSEVNAGKALLSFLVLIFGTMLMVYYFPKLLKENERMKKV